MNYSRKRKVTKIGKQILSERAKNRKKVTNELGTVKKEVEKVVGENKELASEIIRLKEENEKLKKKGKRR